MSGSGHDQRAAYKLIPQSVSEDSDLSEEELHSLYKDGFQIITKKHIFSSDHTIKKKKVQNQTRTFEMNAEKHDVKACNIFNIFDIFPPPKVEYRLAQEIIVMSVLRRISLLMSICTCFLIIGVFLILPCGWANCSCWCDESPAMIWQKAVINVEFKGPVTLLNSTVGNSLNFLLLTRGSIFADASVMRTNVKPSRGGDVFAFNGLNGNQLWRRNFNIMPHEIDCAIFSVKDKPSKDCIITSYWNYITVVSPDTGNVLWNNQLFNKFNRTNDVFPLIVPDLNGDHVDDMLINKDSNKIMAISGLNGNILSQDFKSLSTNCAEIKNLNMLNSFELKLDCKMNNSFSELSIPLKENSASFDKSNETLSQHYSLESLNPIFIRNYTIQVVNEGVLCPRKCKAVVLIKNSKNETIWSHESNYSYAMTPTSFEFGNCTDAVYGFVFKIWEHEPEDTDLKRINMTQFNKKMTEGFIYERIVILIFNLPEEPIRRVNLSYSPILQLYNAQKSIQPDPIAEKDSLVVADVGKNGSHRIITYYSTFEDDKKDGYNFTDYLLKSYIQMYDLDKVIRKEYQKMRRKI